MDQQRNYTVNAPPIGFREFVLLVAALMALTALGIDSMLPALPAIAESLHVAHPNQRQYVLTSYLIGFGAAQLFYGPLSDRYGRRPVLTLSMVGAIVGNLMVALAGSFTLLLVARFVAGIAVAGGRVVAVALVRDCYAGRAMARVMSLAFIAFLATPIIAPNYGAFIVSFTSWRWIFGGTALFTLVVLVWFRARMPETLPEEARQSLAIGRILEDCWLVLRDRMALGYTLAATLLSGSMFGFVGCIQQIMEDTFHRPKLLTFVFACIASALAIGSFANSRLVMRLGTRRISHTAHVSLILVAAVHLAVALSGHETLPIFILLQALMMAGFSLTTSNFSAMAMEQMGEIAGTASSVQGFISTLGGAVLGAIVGQAFDGTIVPLYMGFVMLGTLAFLIVAITERGRLFRPT